MKNRLYYYLFILLVPYFIFPGFYSYKIQIFLYRLPIYIPILILLFLIGIKDKPKVNLTVYLSITGFLLWIGLISIVFHKIQIEYFLKYFKNFLIFIISYNYFVYYQNSIKNVFKAMLFLSLIICTFGLIQMTTYFLWGIHWPHMSLYDPYGNRLLFPKVTSVFSGHRKFGLISGVFTLFPIWEILFLKKYKNIILLLIYMLSIIVSYSRIGYLSFLVNCIIFIIISDYIILKRLLIVFSPIILLLFSMIAFVFNPISTLRYLRIWEFNSNLFIKSPFFGIGFGKYQELTGGGIPHSGYFDILLGAGLIGFVLFLLPFIISAWTFLKDVILKREKLFKNESVKKEAYIILSLFINLFIILFVMELNYYPLLYFAGGIMLGFSSYIKDLEVSKIKSL